LLDEQADIVTELLWIHRKKLNKRQQDLLLAKPDAHKPLYLGRSNGIVARIVSLIGIESNAFSSLVVACEELRIFGVFEKLDEKIKSLSGTLS
jgi:hypothetical protein